MGVAFYRSSNCCVLAYDVTNKASFDSLAKWKRNFLENAGPRNPDTFPIVVIGNKTDLSEKRAVQKEEAEAWCKANGNMPYFETSAI